MAAISEYSEARERWTWRNQVMDDGKTEILSKLRVQKYGGCSYCALVTTLESNVKVQLRRSATFSITQLSDRYEESRTTLPPETKITILLKMIEDHGIKGILNAQRYKIVKYYPYCVTDLEHIRHAMYQLRKGGPLVAVINISENYLQCYKSGLIYRYDPARPVKKKDKSGVIETHAVSVVSFVVEAKVPCFECQDSRGPKFGRNGFLVVDITSVIELYSIKIDLSSS